MTNLLATHLVLHRSSAPDPDRVKFTRERDEEGDVPAVVNLPRATWSDFGCPGTVTVTVRPGDHLNCDDEAFEEPRPLPEAP